MSRAAFTPTEEQQKVIGHTGAAFITACPGAGKARVVVERARLLLKDKKGGQGIAFLSFTNAAVSELESRLRQEALLPSPPFPHFVGTFDSFLWQFLIAPFGITGCTTPPRLIPDKDDRMIRPFESARELTLKCFDRESGEMIPAVTKQSGFDPAAKPGLTKAYVTAAHTARTRFLGRGELDFTDARMMANTRLKDPALSPRLAAALAARFREVIVDESQDCNPADLEFIDWLRKAGIITKVICDPHQSIYAFRGGVTEQLFSFGQTFAEKDQLPMSGNFRSSDNICKAIVTLRPMDARNVIDQALGDYRAEPMFIHILSYSGKGVPDTIGRKFNELLKALKLNVVECPILAATRQSGANAIGQPTDSPRADLTIRLALATTHFHFAFQMGNRKAALEDIHKVVLEIEGHMGAKTYHQYLTAKGITTDVWRPHILGIARDLRYDPTVYANADAWLERARELLGTHLPTGGSSINQRLKRNAALDSVLAIPLPSSPSAQTIHAVKGMEFPAVCVVMSVRTAKGILDYLETGKPTDCAEDSRKIYVAASRAQRLLVIAVPKSQASRLKAHIGSTGAQVTLISL
jgi:DNA helicase-2/ATP-dependent DNA helicase PcrA